MFQSSARELCLRTQPDESESAASSWLGLEVRLERIAARHRTPARRYTRKSRYPANEDLEQQRLLGVLLKLPLHTPRRRPRFRLRRQVAVLGLDQNAQLLTRSSSDQGRVKARYQITASNLKGHRPGWDVFWLK